MSSGGRGGRNNVKIAHAKMRVYIDQNRRIHSSMICSGVTGQAQKIMISQQNFQLRQSVGRVCSCVERWSA